MKTLFRIFLLAIASQVPSGAHAAQATNVQKASTGALTAGFDSARSHTFLSGAAVTFNVGSTLTVNGVFSGTPTGGTLNLSAVTVTGVAGSGDALVANPLSQFAATTSAQLAGVTSDETGFSTGALAVFNINPLILRPDAAQAANEVDITKQNGTKTYTGTSTVTWTRSGTPADGQRYGVRVTTDTALTVTLWGTTFSEPRNVNLTSNQFTIPVGTYQITFERHGSTDVLVTDPITIADLASVSPATGDKIPIHDESAGTDGYALVSDILALGVSDAAMGAAWDGVMTIAPSKNALYDYYLVFDTDYDGKVNVLDLGAGIVKTDASGVVSVAASGTDYEPARTTASQAEAEAGTSTTVKAWTPERVKQAIDALGVGGGAAFVTGMTLSIPDGDSVPSGWSLTGVNGIPAFTTPDADFKSITKVGGTVGTPTADVAPGAVASGTVVTFSSTTASATFRSTTTGTDPTRSSGTVGNTVTVTGDTTYEVIAYRDYYIDSAVASFAYTLSSGSTFTPVFSDDFDSATDGDLLGSRSGWAAVSNNIIINKAGADGALRPNTSGDFACVRTTGTFTADHYSEITIQTVADVGVYLGASVRCQSGADTYYMVVYTDGLNDVTLRVMNAGSATTMDTISSKTYAAGDKLRIWATGTGTSTRLHVQENVAGGGWVNLWTDFNPSVDIDGGTPGVTTFNTDSDIRFDDFVGGDVT